MSKLVRPVVCSECAKAKAHWTEDCQHALELWKDGYSCALRERSRPRLTSDDVRKAVGGISPSWENFHHLVADSLNRILDEKSR